MTEAFSRHGLELPTVFSLQNLAPVLGAIMKSAHHSHMFTAEPTDSSPTGVDPNLPGKHTVDDRLVTPGELFCGIQTRLFKPRLIIPGDRHPLSIELGTPLQQLLDGQVAGLLLRSAGAKQKRRCDGQLGEKRSVHLTRTR
jgi:hypothetical protein